MRQCTSEAAGVPSIRECVADKQILVFLLILPLREVKGITYDLTYLLCDIKEIRLP